jgi:hypothetical protein
LRGFLTAADISCSLAFWILLWVSVLSSCIFDCGVFNLFHITLDIRSLLIHIILHFILLRHEGSGAQVASYLGLDIINNMCEPRDSLHRMTDDFRIGNANWAKPYPYKSDDSVLLSTKHVNLNLPCKKLSPAFVGSYTIRVSAWYERGATQLLGALSTAESHGYYRLFANVPNSYTRYRSSTKFAFYRASRS